MNVRRLDWSRLFALAAYAYVALVLLDRSHAWMSSETAGIKRSILEGGTGLTWRELARSFNYMAMEYGTRVSRPLSSLFEIVDTKFRAWLWHYVLPHPALT